MNRTTRIADIIQKRQPLANKIEKVKANLDSLSSTLSGLEDSRQQLLERFEDSNVTQSLKEIDFSKIQQNIVSELQVLDKLKTRFLRGTLNIGVIGRARQGKSRLLQSLTGLTAAEIPDGSGQHCTGVRSTICHNSSVETYGMVEFYTERTFLDELIDPYYKQLNLGTKPITLEDFASKPLPLLPSDLKGAEVDAKYEHLKSYYQNLDKYRNKLRERSPRQITKDEIREYVAQDNLQGERIYFYYLAVKEVKIVCNFPNNDVGQIALIDLPGLGDTGIGDEERMAQTIGQDIDAVLFVRMPKSCGDFWGDVDVKLYDTAYKALDDLPLQLWSFMVLNKLANESNSKLCELLKKDITNKHINVVECVIANCADTEQANQVLDLVLNYLETKITELDANYAKSCQERLLKIHKDIDAELEKAWAAFGQEIDSEDGLDRFEDLFPEIWKQLAVGLEQLRSELWPQRNNPDVYLKELIDAAIEDCRNDTGIPSIEDIPKRIAEEGGPQSAYEAYQNEIRVHLSQKFLSLDTALKRSLEEKKSQVANVLIKQGHLGQLTEAQGSEFIQAMANLIPQNLNKLKHGFQILADFNLFYRGLVQHRIRQHLDGLTPILPDYLSSSAPVQPSDGISISDNPSPQEILAILQTLHRKAVAKCQMTLLELIAEPSQAAYAIVEEFLDNVLRQKGIDTEWRKFLKQARLKVWPDVFTKLEQDNLLRQEWLKLLNQVAATNQSDSIQFLN